MPVIIIIILIMYVILISWCFNNLGTIDVPKKILYIGIFLLILYIATSITFIISNKGISYPNQNMLGIVKQTLVFIFTGINGIFVMPFLCVGIDKLDQGTISQEQFIKKILISSVIILIILILECGYMSNIQKGIIEIINNKI